MVHFPAMELMTLNTFSYGPLPAISQLQYVITPFHLLNDNPGYNNLKRNEILFGWVCFKETWWVVGKSSKSPRDTDQALPSQLYGMLAPRSQFCSGRWYSRLASSVYNMFFRVWVSTYQVTLSERTWTNHASSTIFWESPSFPRYDLGIFLGRGWSPPNGNMCHICQQNTKLLHGISQSWPE